MGIKTVERFLSEDRQKELITKIITEESDNLKMIDAMNTEFINKNLNVNVIYGVLQESKTIKSLIKTTNDKELMEYIAFITGAYKSLEWSDLKPEKIFRSEDLLTYDGYSNIEIIDKDIHLNKFIKIDDLNYLGRASYVDIAEWWENGKIFYNHKSQRASKLKTIGTKNLVVRELDINEKKVEEISKLMVDGLYEPDQIILNVRIPDNYDNVPQVEYIELMDGIYDINITPNFDRSGNHLTVVDILDGAHRIVASSRAKKAYKDKYGTDLPGGLDVKLVFRNLVEARKIIKQIFERSDTNKEWLQNISEDDITKFTDSIIEKSKVMRGNVTTTQNEYNVLGGYCYKSLLISVLEKMNIPLNNPIAYNKMAKEMAEVIDNLLFTIKDNSEYETFDEMNAKTKLLKPSMWVGYLIISNKLIKEKNNFELIDKLAKHIFEDRYSLFTEMKEWFSFSIDSINSNKHIIKIYNYFQDYIDEVIKGEE